MADNSHCLSDLEVFAEEIIEIYLEQRSLSKSDRKFVRDIIADCLFESPSSERFDRFFNFAMNELKEKSGKDSST